MLNHGVYNISRISKEVNSPQQTVSYHVRRFDKQDLVRFRALINEARLGLKNYLVLASSSSGKEQYSGRMLTSFPLWRYLAVIDGWKRGNLVRYAIPSDKERDLVAYLKELVERQLISGFEIEATSSPFYPFLDLDFYAKSDQIPIFEWQKWIRAIDSFSVKEAADEASHERSEFDLVDLIILRCLEINARTTQRKIVKEISRILGEKDAKKFIPMVSRRIRKNIEPQGLIDSYRAYLFPNQGPSALLLMFNFTFANKSSLGKFVSSLQTLPYNTSYEKILGKDAILLRLVIPAYECSAMREAFRNLAEKGYVKDAHLLLGDLENTWDNVEIYQMFKNNTWNFSYGAAVEMLENILPKNRSPKKQ